MMRWWLDRGVDGFRMDVINMLSKDPDRPEDGWIDGPRIHEYLQEMHREVFAGREERTLTVGETPDVTLEQARLYTDPARGELDMVFQFEHVGLDQGELKWDVRPLRLTDLKRSFGRWQEGLAETGWNSLYWNNHDQPRVVSRFGDDSPEHRVRSAKLLGTILHLHRGTPYVYQGEELGMTNAPFDRIDAFRDIESLNHYAEVVEAGADPDAVLATLRKMSRDNARTPMQWDASEHAGFTSGEPWIPVNPNHAEINADAAVADLDSVFHHYRRLIELRHTEPVVAHGDFTMLLPRRRARVRVHAPARRRRAARARQLLRRGRGGRAARRGRRARARQLRRRGRAGRAAPVGSADPAAMIDTPHGPARAELHPPRDGEPRAALLLGHGAGGGFKARDLQAVTAVARELGYLVAHVEQPYLVAGRKSPAPTHQLDAAWLAVVEHLDLGGAPARRPAGARRAPASRAGPRRRPGRSRCCASPSPSTRRASRRRAGSTSSTASRCRCSSSRASATRSGCRPTRPAARWSSCPARTASPRPGCRRSPRPSAAGQLGRQTWMMSRIERMPSTSPPWTTTRWRKPPFAIASAASSSDQSPSAKVARDVR